MIRENEYLKKVENNADALLIDYSTAGPDVTNMKNFIEDKILRKKQRRRLRDLNLKT